MRACEVRMSETVDLRQTLERYIVNDHHSGPLGSSMDENKQCYIHYSNDSNKDGKPAAKHLIHNVYTMVQKHPKCTKEDIIVSMESKFDFQYETAQILNAIVYLLSYKYICLVKCQKIYQLGHLLKENCDSSDDDLYSGDPANIKKMIGSVGLHTSGQVKLVRTLERLNLPSEMHRIMQQFVYYYETPLSIKFLSAQFKDDMVMVSNMRYNVDHLCRLHLLDG